MKKFLFLSLIFWLSAISYGQNFNYDIKFHRLEFEVDPEINYIKGKITTYFETNTANFNEMTFQLHNDMIVDSVVFRENRKNFTHENDFVNIQLDATLGVGETDSIFVFYQGNPTSSGLGSFTTSTHDGIPIMWTLSEPYGAKSWWPCKQKLNDKADSLEMAVTVPIGNRVAGNGLITAIDTNDQLITVFWKHKYPITAYLVAFAVTNYEEYYDYVEINDTLTIPILNYVYPEDLEYAQQNSPDLIDVFQLFCDTFMIYPYWDEKYGHAQFNWGGGMEHQTMTFLGDFNHYLMAHELAHQWFGDYITCGSWEDIWLNEGFAVYLEGMTAEHGLAPYSWEEWKSGNISYATSLPGGSVFCDDTTSESRIFNNRLTYVKGGMILHQLRWVIGDKAFFNGIRSYLHDPNLAFGYARVDDLKYHFEQECDCDLTNYFNDWYYDEGYPIYNIYWSQNNDNQVNVNISQTQSIDDVDFFELPIALEFKGLNKDTTVVFENTIQNQELTFDINFKVQDIVLDPDFWIITKNSTISKVISQDSGIKIILMPNPVDDKLIINFPLQTHIYDVKIYDANGKNIQIEKPNRQFEYLELNLETLEKGTYFINIFTSNGIVSDKFIKE